MKLEFKAPNSYVGKVLQLKAKTFMLQAKFWWPNPAIVFKIFNKIEIEFHPARWHLLPDVHNYPHSFCPAISFRWLCFWVEWRTR